MLRTWLCLLVRWTSAELALKIAPVASSPLPGAQSAGQPEQAPSSAPPAAASTAAPPTEQRLCRSSDAQRMCRGGKHGIFQCVVTSLVPSGVHYLTRLCPDVWVGVRAVLILQISVASMQSQFLPGTSALSSFLQDLYSLDGNPEP